MRVLVDCEAHTVPEAVSEFVAVPGVRDNVARDGVTFLAGHACRHLRFGFELRLKHYVVNLAKLVVGLSDEKGTS